MPDYDLVAESYDEHFVRQVDRWEDERLEALLAPIVNGADVLDLGCGTGWVLDHLRPRHYTGLDMSAAMLGRLLAKHPGASVYKTEVGGMGWSVDQPWLADTIGGWEVVVATWAAEYFGNLGLLLVQLQELTRRPGVVALHGCQPRGSRRNHFVSAELALRRGNQYKPRQVRRDTSLIGRPSSFGVGALPDCLAHSRRAWEVSLAAPVAWHYSALHIWRF